MKRVVWERIVKAALLCLGGALLLGSFSLLGLTEPPLFAPAGFLLLVALGLGAVAIAPAALASRASLVAYRVLYHAPSAPDSREATRLLHALARHSGRVSVIWRYHPASRGSKAGDLSLHVVAPADWGRALEAILPRLLPGLWAERVPPPTPPAPTMPGRGVRCWRWDVARASSGTIHDPLASGLYMGELAARAGAWDVEAQIHLWRGGVAGLLLAECDLHEAPRDEQGEQGEEEHAVPARMERSTGVQALGESARPLRSTLDMSAPTGRRIRPQRENKRKHRNDFRTVRQADQSVQVDPFVGLGLRLLLGGWLAHRNKGPREVGGEPGTGLSNNGKGTKDTSGTSTLRLARIESAPVPGSALSYGLLAHLRTYLASPMCKHYPLWEDWPSVAEGSKKWWSRSRIGRAASLRAPDLAHRGVSVAGREESEGVREHGADREHAEEEEREVLFPATDGANFALDAHAAGVVAPPASYRLPRMPDRVLVLGRTTAEDRPVEARVVGVPLLRRTVADAQSGSPRYAADNTGVIGVFANAPSSGDRGYLASGSTGSTGRSGRPLRSRMCTGADMALHDFAGAGLLVIGGTGAWRLDVAGSLARQGVEMGVPLIVIEGGPPPDEPPPIARRGARIEVASAQDGGALQGQASGVAGLGDPFAPGPLGLMGLRVGPRDPLDPGDPRQSGTAMNRRDRVAYIDPANPNGSLHVNMLFVPPVRHAATPAIGEVAALILALRVALPAQMRFLDAVGVTGAETGLGISSISGMGSGIGMGDTVIEAWLWVLLVRHHYLRLRYALNGAALTPEELCGLPWQPKGRGEEEASHRHHGLETPGIAPGGMPGGRRHALPCPDLPSVLLLMEQSDALIEALQRERALWEDPGWVRTLMSLGSPGEAALRAVYDVHERVRALTSKDAGDLFRLSAGLRDRLKGAVGQPEMVRMLSGPPASLHDLLDSGANGAPGTGALHLLRVNLEGAYRAVQPPFTDAEGVRKRYGLYLLWAIRAFAQGRKAAARMELAHAFLPAPLNPLSKSRRDEGQPASRAAARPVMLLVHGAGAWFGSGSPLSSAASVRGMGAPGSGVMVAVTVAGLRHIRSQGAAAYSSFGTLVVGPLPVGYEDAPDVDLRQLERENELHRSALQLLERRVARAWNFPHIEGGVADPARLQRVLRRLRDGNALILAPMPGGKLTLCTATTGSAAVERIRAEWAQEARERANEDLPISPGSVVRG